MSQKSRLEPRGTLVAMRAGNATLREIASDAAIFTLNERTDEQMHTMKTFAQRTAAFALVILSALALSPTDGDAQARSIYSRGMCNRLPTASQRVTCRVCVSRMRPRMVYDVASNSCRPFGGSR